MKQLIAAVVCILIAAGISSAQWLGVWNDVPESAIPANQERPIIPVRYRTIGLNVEALIAVLQQAPMEGTVAMSASPVRVSLPLPDGGTREFRVVESPIMAAALAARYPQIRTYLGQGVDNPSATVRFDLTPVGFHAMILSDGPTVYIDPYSRGNARYYISYFKKDVLPSASRRFEEIGIVDPNGDNAAEIARLVAANRATHSGDQLRTYRLALACTGEYATYHGGTKPLVLAAMVTAMNRVNGVYEREVAVRMVLIPNNDTIIYLNAATDPYTNNSGSTMLSQNQSNLDLVIGPANYDIGHVFSTGGGGVAGLGVVCRSGQKARGVTGLSAPIGDPFYIDYVAHEMGHQFGANHPFNSVTSNCGGGNRNASTAYEPGSGSTIMAYAGICGADDLQPHSDDYFHVISLDEILNYTQLGSGNSCPVVTATGNNAPTVNPGTGGFTIPLSTSFSLTGSATDPDNDPLTYCWEEFDLGPAGSPNSPSGNAPIFRSFTGTANPTRIFPKLSDILNNTQTIGEILPSYARSLTFRLTARDNRAGGGGVTRSSSISLTVTGSAGPFTVTAPNTSLTWVVNTIDTVKWNVANTNIAPINCANVSIRLSTDGGQTFPTVLAASTPNDGIEAITVPNVTTTTARVKIEAVGNIFFDMSNVNFAIGAVASPLLASPPNGTTNLSIPVTTRWYRVNSATTYHVQLSNDPGFTTLLVNDSTITDTLRSIGGLNNNTFYYWRVRARNAQGTSGWSETWSFRTVQTPPGAPTLVAPLNNSTGLPTSVILQWNSVIFATSYQVEVATDSGFATTVVNDSVTTTSRFVNLADNTKYYWRVRARNAGGLGNPSAIWNFTVGTVSVSEQPPTPASYLLAQNYPNPFNPITTIRFAVAGSGFVTLKVFDMLGQEVATLVNELKMPGSYIVQWDASTMPSGIYFYRLTAGAFVQTRKLIVTR